MQSMMNDVVASVAERAEALFRSREMYCGEAVMTALNEGLDGGLDSERARGLAMGFGQGLGTAGCICGALSGAVLAASWFLSQGETPKAVREASLRLHEQFKLFHGSSCCRVLTKPVKAIPEKHFEQCAGFTRSGAELAARLILERMPELARAGHLPPRRRGRRVASLLRRLADILG